MTIPFVALTITTSGPDPRRDRVRCVAMQSVNAAGVRTPFSYSADIGRKASLSDVHSAAVAEAKPKARRWQDIAADLRTHLDNALVVTLDATTDLAVLAAEGVRLRRPTIDLAELASLLVPGLGAADLTSLAESLGLPTMSDGSRGEPELLADVFERLLVRIAEYDDLTLERLSFHVSEGGWPFAELFDHRSVSRTRATQHLARLLSPELQFLRDRQREIELEPTGAIDPIDISSVRSMIGPDGALAGVISGFERREQQEQMAATVADTINTGGQILVEAGTGTGKSLAYLVPTAMSAADRGETVLLSTNTLALQDQLLRKDVPDLISALGNSNLGADIKVVSVKGRSNYLCLRKWFPWERQPSIDQDEARLKAKILAWLPRTETGDRAEMSLTGAEMHYWRQVAEEEGACDPGACIFNQRGQCFLFRARRAASAAHLVIVNHALLLTDAASSNRILPDYATLVVDEAHHLEDQATSQFSVTLQERDLVELADALATNDGVAMGGICAGAMGFLLGAAADAPGQKRARSAREKLEEAVTIADAVRGAGTALFAALEGVHAESLEYSSSGDRSRRVTATTRASPAWQAVDDAWDRLLNGLREAEAVLRWFATATDAVDDAAVADLAEAGDRQELLLADLQQIARLAGELITSFANVLDSPEASRVYWLERTGVLERMALRSAPLDVSELLRGRLFNRSQATILTSATLAVDGSCDYLATRLGVPDASSLIVPSPFDYRRSVLLYLADDMPDPTNTGYREALMQTLIDAIAGTQGRALVLFTSHALLADMARAITAPLAERGVTVLAQRRDGTPQQLTERLRRERNIAVLGAASFWEGVDVAGEALSMLIITRLPFSVPTDPVFAARGEAFEDAFNSYAVPQAVLRFKQGFGRLIRTSHDRGICAVLDRRILTKRYGATFLHSLPECSVEVGSVLGLQGAASRWLVGDNRE